MSRVSYRIAYQDGGLGPELPKASSDWMLKNGPKGIAYRIRIREKRRKNPYYQDWRELIGLVKVTNG